VRAVRTASWTVHDDAGHQTLSAEGYYDVTLQTFTLFNPITITKYNANGQTTDEIQVKWDSAATHTGSLADFPLGNISQPNYTAWTTYQYSHTHLASTRVYYNIPSSGVGTAGTNYDVTTYGYENDGHNTTGDTWMGRRNMTKSPSGTITRVVFDAQGNVTSTWVGTHDDGATDADPTGSHTSGNNMVCVSSATYDADGNLTQSTAYQYTGEASTWHGSTPTVRVAQMFYDWRDRLVATKSGVLENLSGETSDGVQRPINYYVMDNLGEVTDTYVYS